MMKAYLVFYRLKRMMSDDWDDMEFALLATSRQVAEAKAQGFLEDTRPERSWTIVAIVEAID
jgi:hypothetical protein